MAENLYVLGCVSWKSPQLSGHSISQYSRTGIYLLIHICANVSTHWCHNHQAVSWESVHSHGLAPGSAHSIINQLDIWNQPEAPHLITTDAFTFQLSAKRLFSVGCQVYTTPSAWRGPERCFKKLNNLGVWARQKFPSVICQLKPIPGRHFACSSKIIVVGQTWLDGALHILGVHICPFYKLQSYWVNYIAVAAAIFAPL